MNLHPSLCLGLHWLLSKVEKLRGPAPKAINTPIAEDPPAEELVPLVQNTADPEIARPTSPRNALEDLNNLYTDTLAFSKSTEYFEFLEYVANFREYRPFNLFLIKAQQPKCGYVATASDWQKRFNRHVQPEARPIVILRPFGPVMFVYDVSQTNPNPKGKVYDVPQITQPFAAAGELPQTSWDNSVKNAEKKHISIHLVRDQQNNAGLAQSLPPDKNGQPCFRVNVNSTLGFPAMYITLLHELAHVLLGHCGSLRKDGKHSRHHLPKATKEFEAESVAYLVAKRAQLQTDHAAYLADYVQPNSTIPPVDLALICSVATTLEQFASDKAPKEEEEQPSPHQQAVLPMANAARA